MMKYRLHCLGLPHTITNADFCACAYTQKVRLFCRMMTERGHHVIHYGHPDSDVKCTEHVDVVSRETFESVYGVHDWKTHLYTFDVKDDAYQEFYRNASAEIWKRKANKIWSEKCTDFLLPFWNGCRPIAEAHGDMIVVEPGIGYSDNHYAPYKVFESHALMHAYYGLKGGIIGHMSWQNTVIPNYFDPEEYTYTEAKSDYLLFLGRVGEAKGVNIALQVAEQTDTPLHIYGQGAAEFRKSWETENGVSPLAVWKGYADIETRRKAFANAKALILPGKYLEPFGGTQVQALLSGTPLITSNWGAYAEVNDHGHTGFRCNTFREFCGAVDAVSTIDPKACRSRGERYTMEAIAPQYEQYFRALMDQRTGSGWYAID
jgi:glycosyltransferase involved in cell wall biosynthesis